MIWASRILFLVVLGTMLAIAGWAASRCALFSIPREVAMHPWFLATLLDAYWAFVAFYVWAAWKERRPVACVLWLVAVLTLWSIAIAAYMLRELFSVAPGEGLAPVFVRRNPGRIALPAFLGAAGLGVLLLA